MITLGVMLDRGTDILLTEYKYSEYLNNFSSNDRYIEHKISHTERDKKEWYSLSAEEIEQKRVREKNNYIDSRKSKSIGIVISCITWLLVGSLFFLVHWRLYKKQ
jgi:hypothetical protein